MAEPAPGVAIAQAEALGARLPPLVVQAERIAATVMQGVHGRRRAGQGDAFWQFRPYLPGDAAGRVDWRQSARAERVFIRETEWEAAQSVALWSQSGPGMAWRSRDDLPRKQDRADVLLLALGALLLRGGERLRAFGARRAFTGQGALVALAGFLPHQSPVPRDASLPRHARLVLFGDFLAPLAETRRQVAALAAQGLRGHMLQILDPAEETLPFAGHTRFEDPAGGAPAPVPRVESIRAPYLAALARHRAGLQALTAAAGWSFATHRTDHAPGAALLALYQRLAPG